MSTQMLLFLLLMIAYFLHDMVLSKFFFNRFHKAAYYLGEKASTETQRFFGKSIFMVMIYYGINLIYLLTGYTFGGLVSDISFFDSPSFRIIGFLTGITALVLMVLSRLNLGSSWRVGLDKTSTEPLVAYGFYEYIRNPYFLFLLIFQFSIILVVPNAITIFAFIQSLILLKLQVYQEEAFLQEKYGEAYIVYKNSTGRFFPKI